MESNKKYAIDKSQRIKFDGKILYRIYALIDIINGDGELVAKSGTWGGFVEHESNLSQDGGSWIGRNAKVYGNALVKDNALVTDNAIVCDAAIISYYGIVKDNASVKDTAKVLNNAVVFDNAVIRDKSEVADFAKVYGHAVILGESNIHDKSNVYGNVCVKNIWTSGNAQVYGDTIIKCCWESQVRLYENAILKNTKIVCEHSTIHVIGDVRVENSSIKAFFTNGKIVEDAINKVMVCHG